VRVEGNSLFHSVDFIRFLFFIWRLLKFSGLLPIQLIPLISGRWRHRVRVFERPKKMTESEWNAKRDAYHARTKRPRKAKNTPEVAFIPPVINTTKRKNWIETVTDFFGKVEDAK